MGFNALAVLCCVCFQHGYLIKPSLRTTRRLAGAADGPLRVAVVGSGPVGCHAIEELMS